MRCEPRSRQIENLLQLAKQDSSGASLHLAAGLRVAKNRGRLNFKYPGGAGPFRGNIENRPEIEFPETTIPGPGIYDFTILNRRLVIEDSNGCIPGSGDLSPTGEYLDSGLFSFPLTIRGPRPGERFYPLGAPGSKKISDFLSDQKIARNIRAQIPVLCSGDNVLALPGLRIDHRFRITGKTTRSVRVRWQEMEKPLDIG